MQTPAGNELQYTFVQDFRIASMFGEGAVRDTFTKVWEEWKGEYTAVAEIAIATNWESWRFYHLADSVAEDDPMREIYSKMCELYANLYQQVDEYAHTELSQEEFDYSFQMTD